MNIKEQLARAITAAATAAMDKGTLPKGELPEVLLEEPPEKSFGDFATNFAMQAARPLKGNPRTISAAITAEMSYPWLDH